MTKAKRHNEPWTRADLSKLRRFARVGLSAREAAPELGRTVGALKYKAMVEGIRFHAINQPRGVQRRLAARKARTARARARAGRKAAIARRVRPAGAVRLLAAAALS